MDSLPSDFDIEAYTTFASYAPIHTPFKRDVFSHFETSLARNVLTVADAIAQHAGPTGLCWPLTFKHIMGIAHIRFDAAKSGLMGLIDKDWIREIRTPLPGRRVPFLEWQLHPHTVLHIGREHLIEAFELWGQGAKLVLKSSQLRERDLQLQHPDLQLQYKPESESRINQKHPEANPTDISRDGQKNFHEVEIDQCREPLKNYRDEEFAHYVKTECKTHLSVARQLILSYGRIEVENALGRVKQIMAETEVRKPGGALRSELRRRRYMPSYQDVRG